MTEPPPQIPVHDVRIEDEELVEVERTLRSGWLSLGSRTEEIERDFARAVGVDHGVAVSSCTAALHLACIAAGIGPGDEVIVPSMTFVATVNAVRYVGATPVFADVVSHTDLGMDVDHALELIGPRTRAVIPVHYAGYSMEIERLVAECDRRGLVVIEDAAHAPTARARPGGPRLGGVGLGGCFSFFPNKVLGIGEGGMLTTDSEAFADRVRKLRSHGITINPNNLNQRRSPTYDVAERGFNYRFDDVHAAILSARFGRLEVEIAERRRLMANYREALAPLEQIDVAYAEHDLDLSAVYLAGVVSAGAPQRRYLRERLRSRHGVQTTMYPAVHKFTSFEATHGSVSLPRTERAAAGLFSIPMFPHMSSDEQERVIDAIHESVDAMGLEGVLHE